MKAFLFAVAMAATIAPPASAADVGVSISIGQPGFYGHIDIGNLPSPRLVYPQPVLVQPAGPEQPPIYLRVPPGHAKHWRKHCHEYNACGQRVYFVQDDWYNNVYVPHYREHAGHRDEHGGDNHERRDHDRRDHERDHDHDRDHR